MLILLSPAKTLDLDPSPIERHTLPRLQADVNVLLTRVRTLKPRTLQKLMGVSEAIANLNVERYQRFEPDYELNRNAKQALFTFKGDVYRDWPLSEYTEADLDYAQEHLRILSGLYGLLRPLDLIQPYRLEMGTGLKTRRGRDLYAFWGNRITAQINEDVAATGAPAVLNLASNEYFKSVRRAKLQVPVVSPVFEDWKAGKYKVISFFAKRARGMMAHFVIQHRVRSPDGLMGFTQDGYRYDPGASTSDTPVFRRKQAENNRGQE